MIGQNDETSDGDEWRALFVLKIRRSLSTFISDRIRR